MKLFTYENYKLNISEEAYCIKAFRDIFKRDRSVHKERAIMELGYIYFLLDPRSDYNFITDENERSLSIIEQEGFQSGWKPDEKIKKAMEVYTHLTQTSSSLLLQDTRLAIDKARIFLRDLDLSEVDDKGKPKYTINSFVSAIKDIPKLVKELSDAERAVNQEIAENGRMRANKMKKVGEDGFDVFI